MEELKKNYSFQVDSVIVKEVYNKENNYLIEFSSDSPDSAEKYCILYFASNDLYYPNTEIAFQEQLIQKNRFEWYKLRLNIGSKHIFLRDIQKQWYLGGINSRIDNPEKLFDFLKEETKGYQVISVGSSAGGFAAVIYGQLLYAERIYSFNGQFEIRSILDSSSETIDPLIYRYRDNQDLEKWYDARNFISNPSTIYYFQSAKSDWDIEQYALMQKISVNCIQFNTSNHGIPFLKTNLPFVLNSTPELLQQWTRKVMHPIVFSINTVGLFKTVAAISAILKFGINKIYIHTLLKFK